MAEYVNKNNLIKLLEGKSGYAQLIIDDMPTIDIITCRECKWLSEANGINCLIRERIGISRLSFFCADGER